MDKKLPPSKAVIKPATPTKPPAPAAITTAKPLPPPPKGGEWSSYQKDVFNDVGSGSGHTVVEAYAGSAKTTTIVGALGMVSGREKVFFSAFNKRIVDELKDKVPWTVDVSTLHSYGFRAIKEKYGKDTRPNTKRVRGMLDEMCERTVSYETRGQIAKLVSLAKNSLVEDVEGCDALIDSFSLSIGCDDIHICSVAQCKKRAGFIRYALDVLQRCKTETYTGEIDFDDMIWLPIVNEIILPKFDRVFVDECQDLNPAQVALVMRAVGPRGRFTAVGDEHQAIYLFRGADSNSIRNLREHFGAKTLPLPICYRCPVSVVELAQEVVPGILPAPGAPQGVVGDISANVMYEEALPGDFVLSRTNAPLLRHAMKLIANNKRAIVYGRDIGNMLMAFVRRSKQTTVEELLKYTMEHVKAERERLLKCDPPRKPEFQMVLDTAMCIEVVADECDSVQEVLEKIDRIFTDADDKNSIVLSTVHKAKGLESKRVFVLIDTFRHRPEYWQRFARTDAWLEQMVEENTTREELNIWYVAITRAKAELLLTRSPNPSITSFEDQL